MMTNINKHDCFQNHIIIIRPERRSFHKCGAQMGFLQLPAASLRHGDPPAGGRVVINTPQEGPHGRAAIRAALPQGEKLDRRPRPPIAEEPPKPAKPSKTCGQTSRGEGGRNADLPLKFALVGGV